MGVQLATATINEKNPSMEYSFDMWQLGMLIYQLASQPWPYTEPYWGRVGGGSTTSLTDAAILQRLFDYHHRDGPEGRRNAARVLLPHEAKPLQNNLLRLIVNNLLAPTAQGRWTSDQLRIYLDLHATELTMQGQKG
jgi:hypothetical protein